MKKIIIILAAALCALAACQKHEIELLDKPIIEQIDGNTYTYTFSAVISDNVSEVEEDGTKATVSRAGAFTWVEGDKLIFFPSEGEPAEAEVTDVSGSTATITVTTGSPRSNFVSAIYPANAALSKNRISFNASGPIVVAEITDGGTLTFHHIGSLINLKFYEISALTEIKSLVFEPANPFTYDGSFTFDGSHVPSLTPTGSTEKIVVPASSARNDEDITVVVPSVNLSGFSAALNDKADGTGRNLFKKSTSTDHDLAASRPVLMNMKRVAYTAPTYFVSINGAPNLPLIKTGASTYTSNLDTDVNVSYCIYDSYNETELATSTTTPPTTDGVWKLVGNIKDIDWVEDDWTYQFKYYNGTNWNYVKDVQFSSSTASFKISKGDNWNANMIVATTSDNSTPVGSGFIASYYDNGSYGNDINFTGVDTDKKYDIYINADSSPTVYVMNSGEVPDGISYGSGSHATFTWNGSSASAANALSYKKVTPWGWGTYITTEQKMQLYGDWGSGNTANDMTYNNFTWSYTGLIIATGGTFSFMFRTKDEDNSWGNNTITGIYGRAVKGGEPIVITLTAGIYNVYANAIEPNDPDHAYLNYSFIKQP